MAQKMKEYEFGMIWQVYGKQSVMVPINFTEEEAREYVLENIKDIPLPEGDYLEDSDEPDFENAGFVEQPTTL